MTNASLSSLIVRRTRLSTVGDRSFPVAKARVSATCLVSTVIDCFPESAEDTSSVVLSIDSLNHNFVVPAHFGHSNRSCYLLTYDRSASPYVVVIQRQVLNPTLSSNHIISRIISHPAPFPLIDPRRLYILRCCCQRCSLVTVSNICAVRRHSLVVFIKS